MSERKRFDWRPYALISPFFVIFAVFSLYAIGDSLYLSFTSQQGVAGGKFVGFANYVRLFKDDSYHQALINTAYMWLMTVPLLSLGSLAVAWMIQSPLVRFQGFLRGMLFLPVVPSIVVSAITILLLLDPNFGLPNLLLQKIGFPALNIRAQQSAAVPVLALVVIWRWFGYNVVIHAAGLQSLPASVLEAAKIDGAGAWQVFWLVVVPMSRPMIVFTFIASTIGVFNLFDEPYVLFGTGGGPAEAGLLPGPLLFRTGFSEFRLGYASAMAYALAVIIFIASLFQLRLTRERD
jgi:lactose/L-arabinose transport system permease protein